MRLSATDIYAFQALAFLGTQPRDRWVGSDAISAATGVVRPYLVRILATLTAHDLVVSKKGAGGGYALAREAGDINLRDVMRAIDGPVAPLSCVSLRWHHECPEAGCGCACATGCSTSWPTSRPPTWPPTSSKG
jgi:Rrf2 family protein